MTRPAWMALLLPWALAGCGSTARDPFAHLESPRQAVEGLVGRTCHYVSRPVPPSTVDAILRPGTRGSILLWGRQATAADTVEVSVRYGDDGRLAWARAIGGTMVRPRVAELERMLGAALVEETTPDWGVRIRVVGGEVDAVLPSVACPPERGALIARAVPPVGTDREVQEAWQARGRQLELEVGLDSGGRVMEVRLVRGSGSRLLDQYAQDLARAHRYYPKLHDGIGVPSRLAVRLQIPRRLR